MTALPPEVRRAAEPVGVGGFEIGYVTDDGLEHRVSLSQAWATPFESCRLIRRFTSHKGQRHLSGCWWSATDGRHVGFESWLERDLLRTFSRRSWKGVRVGRVASHWRVIVPPGLLYRACRGW